MEFSMMKNIVVLKNLPSNIVDEAFVVLKENERIQVEDLIKYENSKEEEKQKEKQFKENDKDYIVKEAEMLIADYISNIEKRENENMNNTWKIKYKKSAMINCGLGILFIISLIMSFI